MKESSDQLEKGLYQKYDVEKGGESVDSCFVLEPRNDRAARAALMAYAEATDHDQLAEDLRAWVFDLDTRGDTRE